MTERRVSREALRIWLDRKPVGGSWRDWYEDIPYLDDYSDDWAPICDIGAYLGVRSARVGPDAVPTSQPCRCDTCLTAKMVPVARPNESAKATLAVTVKNVSYGEADTK